MCCELGRRGLATSWHHFTWPPPQHQATQRATGEYLVQNLNLNFRAKREEKFCLNTWSQTRIRPGFQAKTHEQEQSQEPDAHQARIRGREPRARAKSRARRASGQDSRPRAPSKNKGRACRANARARRLEKTIPDTQGSGKIAREI